jgi:hypothetical protein
MLEPTAGEGETISSQLQPSAIVLELATAVQATASDLRNHISSWLKLIATRSGCPEGTSPVDKATFSST